MLFSCSHLVVITSLFHLNARYFVFTEAWDVGNIVVQWILMITFCFDNMKMCCCENIEVDRCVQLFWNWFYFDMCHHNKSMSIIGLKWKINSYIVQLYHLCRLLYKYTWQILARIKYVLALFILRTLYALVTEIWHQCFDLFLRIR